MATVSHVWALCSLLLFVEACLCAHLLLKKGSNTSIFCAFLKNELNTVWQVRAGHDFINVTSCTFGQNICVDHMPQQFRGNVEKNSFGFTSRLVIINARINETEFRCLSKFSIVSNTLEVYAQPSKPVCDPVELDYTKKNLQFRCHVTKVFPSVSALLYIRGVKVYPWNILSFHCSNEESSFLALDGYSAECVWRVSAAHMEPIKYKYFVNVFPRLSNNSTGIPNAISQDYPLKLSSPSAVIDHTHCKVGPGVVDGKILAASTATCRCVLESHGFPYGQTRWYKLHGNQSLGRDNIADGSSTLEIYNNTQGQCGQHQHLSAVCSFHRLVYAHQHATTFLATCQTTLMCHGRGLTGTYSQSYQCRAESSLNNPLNWGPVYTPVFTTPSSDPETYSLRIEILAGILAGSVGLTVIIAVVIWKLRSRKRQNADTTRQVYNTPGEGSPSDSGKHECSGGYATLAI